MRNYAMAIIAVAALSAPRPRRAAAARRARRAAADGRSRRRRKSSDVRRVRVDAGAGSAEDQRRAVSRSFSRASRRCRTCGARRCRSGRRTDPEPAQAAQRRAAGDEAQLKERLKALAGARHARAAEVRKAYDAIDQVLDVRAAGQVPRVRRDHGAAQARARHARAPGEPARESSCKMEAVITRRCAQRRFVARRGTPSPALRCSADGPRHASSDAATC